MKQGRNISPAVRAANANAAWHENQAERLRTLEREECTETFAISIQNPVTGQLKSGQRCYIINKSVPIRHVTGIQVCSFNTNVPWADGRTANGIGLVASFALTLIDEHGFAFIENYPLVALTNFHPLALANGSLRGKVRRIDARVNIQKSYISYFGPNVVIPPVSHVIPVMFSFRSE